MCSRSEKGYNQMYLIPLYDLLNKVYTDVIIQPIRKRNEFAALYELIDGHTPCGRIVPVFIADRGYIRTMSLHMPLKTTPFL